MRNSLNPLPVPLRPEQYATQTANGQYFLDEPTMCLHFADIQRLLDVLHRLVDNGNTIVVIEHNLEVMNAADHIIDLDPEGGDDGGYLVAQGTPEQLVQEPASSTGQFLADVVKNGR